MTHPLQRLRRPGLLGDGPVWGELPVTTIDPEANQKGKPAKVIDAQTTPARPEGTPLYTGPLYAADPARPPYGPTGTGPDVDLPATTAPDGTPAGDNPNPGDKQDPPPAAAPGFFDSTAGKLTAAALLLAGGVAIVRALD